MFFRCSHFTRSSLFVMRLTFLWNNVKLFRYFPSMFRGRAKVGQNCTMELN